MTTLRGEGRWARSGIYFSATSCFLAFYSLLGISECAQPDADGDGSTVEEGDCDDSNSSVYPGAPEGCDGLDNDCNGEIDGGDSDVDGVANDCDNCPAQSNPAQENSDSDALGDACDPQRWSDPELVEGGVEVASPGLWIAPNGLSLYYSIWPVDYGASGFGGVDLVVSTRASRNEPFGPFTNLGQGVNSDKYESAPSLTADELEIFFAVGTSPNGSMLWDIYHANRSSVSEPFGTAVRVTNVSTDDNESSPSISYDGLTLYFARMPSSGAPSGDEILVCNRPDRSSDFSQPVALTAFDSEDWETHFSINPDGLSAVLTRGHYIYESSADGYGLYYNEFDLFTVQRASLLDAFSPPEYNGELSVDLAFDGGGASMTADGQEIFFVSNRDPVREGFYAIYRSVRTR